MIVYRKTNGLAHDLRIVDDDYEPEEGEIAIAGYELPALASLNDPEDPKTAANKTIDARIRALEEQVTPRRLREAVRGTGMAWLEEIDGQINALRAQRQ